MHDKNKTFLMALGVSLLLPIAVLAQNTQVNPQQNAGQNQQQPAQMSGMAAPAAPATVPTIPAAPVNPPAAPANPAAVPADPPTAAAVSTHPLLDSLLQNIAAGRAKIAQGVTGNSIDPTEAASLKSELDHIESYAQKAANSQDLSQDEYAKISGRIKALYAKYNLNG